MFLTRDKRRVFVSYRRADSAPHAANIARVLGGRLGDDQVFWDQDDIEYGDEFPRKITDQLDASDTVVVVIGNQWLNIANDAGQRRLDDAKDFVRIEVETALRSKKRVLPVLVDDAKMPKAEDLPASLAPLASLNAKSLGNQRIKDDLASLANAITGDSPGARAWTLMLRTLAVGLLIAPLVFSLLGQIRFFEGFFGLDIHLESLLAASSARQTPQSSSDRVALVVIDADSQRRLGVEGDRPAAWRAHHARLIRQLATAGVRLIAFDLRFDSASADDGLMRAALDEAARREIPVVAAATQFDANGSPLTDAGFKDAISAWGHACIGLRDQALPRIDLVLRRESGNTVRALALAAAELAGDEGFALRVTKKDGLRVLQQAGGESDVAFPGARTLKTAQIQGCEAQVAGDTAYPLRFDLSPRERLRAAEMRFSYAAILDPANGAVLDSLRGKIVIVGHGNDAGELFGVQQGTERAVRQGVELQADAIRALLDIKSVGDVITPLETPWQVVLITGVCVLGMLLAVVAGPLARTWRALLVIAFIAAYFWLASFAYREAHVVLPLSYPIAAAMLTFFATRNAFSKGGLP